MKRINLFRALIIAVLAVTTAFFIPIPYILRAPGCVENTAQLITIAHHPHRYGNFYLTTVIYEKANLLYALYPVFNHDAELIPQEEGQLQGVGNYEQYMKEQMQESKYIAQVAALRYLGYNIPFAYYGIKVLGILPQSRARQILQPQDIIFEVEGHKVNSQPELVNFLQHYDSGEAIEVRFKRRQSIIKAKVPLMAFNHKTMLGIQVQSVFKPSALPVPISINSKFINGSSAGLMFALEIINRFTPGGLTQHDFAGTGTLDAQGLVGRIEGVKFKMLAAQSKGLRYFLLPQDNLEEARSCSGKLRLIPVHSLKDAVDKIKRVDKLS